MKLNKKGYMLIEIIVSFALAFAIFIFLANLLIKFKNTNEDLTYETKYLTDKNLITRNIMDDLDKAEYVADIYVGANTAAFHWFYKDENQRIKAENRKLEITTDENGKTKIRYGKVDKFATISDHKFVTDDKSYYEKTIESSLTVSEIIEIKNNYFVAKIPMHSNFSDKDYGIKISAKRKYRFDVSINVCLKNEENINIDKSKEEVTDYKQYYSGFSVNNENVVKFDTKIDGKIMRKGTGDTCEYFDKGTSFAITNMTINGNSVPGIGNAVVGKNDSTNPDSEILYKLDEKDENELVNYISFIIWINDIDGDNIYSYMGTEIRESPYANRSTC